MSFANAFAARIAAKQTPTETPVTPAPLSGNDEMRRAVEAFKARQGIVDSSRVRVLTPDEYRKERESK